MIPSPITTWLLFYRWTNAGPIKHVLIVSVLLTLIGWQPWLFPYNIPFSFLGGCCIGGLLNRKFR